MSAADFSAVEAGARPVGAVEIGRPYERRDDVVRAIAVHVTQRHVHAASECIVVRKEAMKLGTGCSVDDLHPSKR